MPWLIANHSGIGLETTILFAREGASVLMADISAPALEKGLAKVKEVLPNIEGKIETIVCDVSKESDVAKMVEHLDSWGGCDIIFNNAGIMHADDAGQSEGDGAMSFNFLTSLQMQLIPPRRSGT